MYCNVSVLLLYYLIHTLFNAGPAEGMCDTCGRTRRQFFGTSIGADIFKILLKKDDIFSNSTGWQNA